MSASRPGTRRRFSPRAALVGVLVAIVLFLWQCTGAFDLSSDAEAISVFGPLLGTEAEAFAEVLADFEERTGIEVRYTGSADFETDMRARVVSGTSTPDVALIPQPGLMIELIGRGAAVSLSDDTVAAIDENFDEEDADLGLGGEVYFVPYRTNVKSLVWYRPDMFDAAGWELPDTLDELGELVEQIDEDGSVPWCFSVFSGTATGWPATDWVEDLMLRRAGPEAYDDWLYGELAYDSPEVIAAFDEFTSLVLGPGRSADGTSAILERRVQDASAPLFADPAGCALYKQASFATAWFPDGTEIGPDGDVDFFVLPGVEATDDAPLLRGVDGLMQFSDRDEVSRLMEFLATPRGVEPWVRDGGFLSDQISVELDDYRGVDRRFAELLLEDRDERYDASDFLPSGTRELFLDELTQYIAGSLTLESALDGVDEQREEETRALRENLPGEWPDES